MPTAHHSVRRLLTALSLGAAALLIPVVDGLAQAQAPAPAAGASAAGAPPAAGGGGRGGGGGGPAKTWWVEKFNAGAYKAPMRPLWKLSDLKAMHAGQHTWSTQIIRDLYQDVTYQSAAPGTKFNPRIHPNTPMSIVVTGGQINFNIEGQQPFTAKRGSIVLVPAHRLYSYDVPGNEDALFVVTHNLDYQTLYPSAEPAPRATGGGQVIQVSWNNTPQAYPAGQLPHWNLFDAIAACQPMGVKVRVDHIQFQPLLGWFNPADNKCEAGGRGNAPAAAPSPIDTKGTTFGHLHKGPAEWWIVQAGQIQGNFENQGTFLAIEGDVLYAQPDMWHQMYAVGPSGPSVRLAAYGALGPNLGNTANAGRGAGGD